MTPDQLTSLAADAAHHQGCIDAIRKQLLPALQRYATHTHHRLEVEEDTISFSDGTVSFTAGGSARGEWFTEHLSVSWDIFADPEAYIKREVAAQQAAKVAAEQAKETKRVRDREAEERRTYERLQAKYGEGKS